MIEEGMEMSIDIDLLAGHSYFRTDVYADADDAIAEALSRETAAYLWLMVQAEHSRPKLSVGHLCELANIPLQAMLKYVGCR